MLYARLSVTTEESVSIARQLESAHRYCEARNWKVMAEYTDDGISASKVKPEDRPGWRALLDSTDKFDAVVVWKIDRLARKVIDFLHADETLQARG
ncbi:MAG: site-specific recombinase, partial [Marmoricola sp.]|nr:site-specific recombinase [Marmoricola sp.]